MPGSNVELPPRVAAQDLSPTLWKLNIPMAILPTVFVAIRLWSRLVLSSRTVSGNSTRKLWWDDWACLFGLVFSLSTIGIGFKMIDQGLGRHVETLQLDQITKLLKLMFATYFTFNTGTAVSRSSALFFYARLFNNCSTKFRYALWTVHILNASWLAGILFAIIFECNPIAKAYNPSLEGKCSISAGSLWLGSVTTSIVVDFLILILPLPLLWRLQMKLHKKVLVTVVFICAYAVIVVSVGQLIATVKYEANFEKDFSYSSVTPCYWMACETPVTVMSVSLPMIYSFVKKGYREGFASLLPGSSFRAKLTHSLRAEKSCNAGRRGGHSFHLMTSQDVASLNHAYNSAKEQSVVNIEGGSSLSSLTRQRSSGGLE